MVRGYTCTPKPSRAGRPRLWPGSEHLVVGKEGFPGAERTGEAPRGRGRAPPRLLCVSLHLGSVSHSFGLGHPSLPWVLPAPRRAFCHPVLIVCSSVSWGAGPRGDGVCGDAAAPRPLWVPLGLDVGRAQREAGGGRRAERRRGRRSAGRRVQRSGTEVRFPGPSVLDSGSGHVGCQAGCLAVRPGPTRTVTADLRPPTSDLRAAGSPPSLVASWEKGLRAGPLEPDSPVLGGLASGRLFRKGTEGTVRPNTAFSTFHSATLTDEASVPSSVNTCARCVRPGVRGEQRGRCPLRAARPGRQRADSATREEKRGAV